MCVVSYSLIRIICRNTNACILDSVPSLAVCVIICTVLRVIWKNMFAYTVMSVHIGVLCVKKCLILRVIWSSITGICLVKGTNLYVMSVTNHSPFCMILKDINCYIVKAVNIDVIYAVCHSFCWEHSKHICWSIPYPYYCDLCVKGFSQQSALEKYNHVHPGEHLYICIMCDSLFTQNECSDLSSTCPHWSASLYMSCV